MMAINNNRIINKANSNNRMIKDRKSDRWDKVQVALEVVVVAIQERETEIDK